MVAWFFRGVAAELDAKVRLRDGGDPASAIAAGRAALNEAMRLAPDSAYVHLEASRLGLLEARWAAQGGHRTAAMLAMVRAEAERAIALDKQLAEAKLVAAEVLLQIATDAPSQEVIDRGLAYVDQVLARSPGLPR